ncbi:hypothetical protein DFH06DRAFT_1145813 [Mycena polygramma]|nr:hypothetical protein DFH06DRAFT_1145813 [Mycena polygramma]
MFNDPVNHLTAQRGTAYPELLTAQLPELRNLECGGTVRKQESFQDKVIAKELEFVTKSNPREGRGKRNRVIREQIQRRNSKELEFIAKSRLGRAEAKAAGVGRGKKEQGRWERARICDPVKTQGGKKQQGHWERDSKELKFVTESNAREGRGKKQLGDWDGGSKELEFGTESTKAMSGSDCASCRNESTS